MEQAQNNRFSEREPKSKLYVNKDCKVLSDSENQNATSLDDELFIKEAFKISPEKGCELLFRRYHIALCSHAVRYVYSKEIAEDIVSNVFCKFWKNQSYLTISSSYRFYIFRSVRNEAFSYLKSEFKDFTSLDDSIYTKGSDSLRPDNITQYDESFNRVKELVDALPPQCKKVFLMSRFEGKKAPEIAQEMGLSIKTIETHLTKGLSTIKKGLKDYLSFSLSLLLILLK